MMSSTDDIIHSWRHEENSIKIDLLKQGGMHKSFNTLARDDKSRNSHVPHETSEQGACSGEVEK